MKLCQHYTPGGSFFYKIYDRDGLVQCLTEFNLLTIIISEIYLCLNLKLPHNWTSQTWYNKSQAITCRIWIILSLLWFFCAEISIRPYHDIAVTGADIYTYFVSSLKVSPYPLDSLTMYFSWILVELRTLVHCVCNVWSSTLFQVVKLSHDTAIVKLLVYFSRILTFSRYDCGEVWSIPWGCVIIL